MARGGGFITDTKVAPTRQDQIVVCCARRTSSATRGLLKVVRVQSTLLKACTIQSPTPSHKTLFLTTDRSRSLPPLVTDRRAYLQTLQEGKGQVLGVAVREIDKMLTDNLYGKFRASAEYKNIEDKLSALEELGG